MEQLAALNGYANNVATFIDATLYKDSQPEHKVLFYQRPTNFQIGRRMIGNWINNRISPNPGKEEQWEEAAKRHAEAELDKVRIRHKHYSSKPEDTYLAHLFFSAIEKAPPEESRQIINQSLDQFNLVRQLVRGTLKHRNLSTVGTAALFTAGSYLLHPHWSSRILLITTLSIIALRVFLPTSKTPDPITVKSRKISRAKFGNVNNAEAIEQAVRIWMRVVTCFPSRSEVR